MNVLQLPLPTTALRELEHMRDSHQQPAFPLLEDPTQKVTIEREALVEFMAEVRTSRKKMSKWTPVLAITLTPSPPCPPD